VFEYGFTATVKRPAGQDRFGNPLPPVPPWSIDGCGAAPAGSSELVHGQTVTIDQDTLYAPIDAVIESTDLIEIPAGQVISAGVYQVLGNPQRWRNPLTGTAFGCLIRIERVS